MALTPALFRGPGIAGLPEMVTVAHAVRTQDRVSLMAGGLLCSLPFKSVMLTLFLHIHNCRLARCLFLHLCYQDLGLGFQSYPSWVSFSRYGMKPTGRGWSPW